MLKRTSQCYVMDGIPFLAHCLLTLSCAVCLCAGLSHICEKQQTEVQSGNAVAETVVAMRLVGLDFFFCNSLKEFW